MIVYERIGHSPHHPIEPQIVHWEECAIEEDEREGEMNLAPSLVHHATKHLQEPEVNPHEYSEKTAAEQYVMNVRNNEVGVVDEEVDRRRSHVDSAQTSDHEHRYKRQSKPHWCRESDRATPNRSHPVKRLNGRRTGDNHRRKRERGREHTVHTTDTRD